eukprot:COSAG02_NODE_71627_length_190_cov_32.857143_1_plen_58_part_01
MPAASLFGKYTAFSLLFAVMKSACLCTVVIPEGPVELKTTAYIDEKNWGPSTCYIQPL